MRQYIQIIEAATQGELERLADLATQCDSVEQFIQKTDGMDVLYRGHYDDQTGNNVFMTDYVAWLR